MFDLRFLKKNCKVKTADAMHKSSKVCDDVESPLLIITIDKHHSVVKEALSLSKNVDYLESNSGGGDELVTLFIPLVAVIGTSFISTAFDAFWAHLIKALADAKSKGKVANAKIQKHDEIYELSADKIQNAKIYLNGNEITIKYAENLKIKLPITSQEKR